MSIVRKSIEKTYLILCEGKDAEQFLIKYLESGALAKDHRFCNDIQVLDFGGNDNLNNFLMSLKNMDKFDQVTSLAVIRDAEKDYDKACQEIRGSLKRAGFVSPKRGDVWEIDDSGIKIGFILFPLNNNAGTLEDLCIRLLSEKDNKDILSSVEHFLTIMESSYGRCYHRKHKNILHTYLASSDEYVTMPLGLAAGAGAFDWDSDELAPLKHFLTEGFGSTG